MQLDSAHQPSCADAPGQHRLPVHRSCDWAAGIDRCYVVEKKKDEPGAQFRVQTDGINFEGAFINDDLVDVNAVTCNDVGAVLRTFGVEAARRTVVAEVGGVFSAYGIGVDSRHLSLISDHMTRQVGLASSVSFPGNARLLSVHAPSAV